MNFYKNNIKYVVLLFILVLNILRMYSQEVRAYSIFPEYNIPAYCGIDRCDQIIFHNNISPLSNNMFIINNDLYAGLLFPSIKSSLSILLGQKNYPYKIYSESFSRLAYVYHLKLSKSKYISFSIPIIFQLKRFNSSNAITPSMIDEWGNIIGNVNVASEANFDYHINFSSVYYTKNFKFGINVSDLYSNSDIFRQFSNKELDIYSSYLYQIKNRNQNLDLSMYLKYNSLGIFPKIGIEYQGEVYKIGISYGQNINKIQTFLLGVNAGIKIKRIELYYSYEQRVGYLYNGGYNSNEIFFIYQIKCLKKNQNNAIICPIY